MSKQKSDVNEALAKVAGEERNRLVYIPTERLHPHPDNPRRDLGDLSEMADSIKAKGVMQNLTVVPREDGDYTVIIGHRRHAAATLARVPEVPCVIADMDYKEQLTTMLTENVQRVDLTVREQAQSFRQLSMDLGMSAESIAKQTGFSASTVRRRLKRAELSPDALDKAYEGGKQLTMKDMERICEIEDLTEREHVLGYVGSHNFEYYLSTALKEQKVARAKTEWTEILTEMDIPALPASEKYNERWEKVGVYALAKKPDREWIYKLRDEGKIARENTVRYFFDTYPDALIIYKDHIPDAKEEAAQKEKDARAAEYTARGEVVRRIRAAFDQVAELRRAFVADYLEVSAREMLPVIARHAVMWLTGDGELGIIMDQLLGYIGSWEDDSDMTAILAEVEKRPCHALLSMVYSAMEYQADAAYPCNTWDYTGEKTYTMGEYRQNQDYGVLSDVYGFLTALGYEMSDHERELMDGTSPLYWENGGMAILPEKHSNAPESASEEEHSPEVVSVDELADEEKTYCLTRYGAIRTMSPDEFEQEYGKWMTSDYVDLHEADTVEAMAERMTPMFCPDGDGVVCAEHEKCEACIAAWLMQPYRPEGDHV